MPPGVVGPELNSPAAGIFRRTSASRALKVPGTILSSEPPRAGRSTYSREVGLPPDGSSGSIGPSTFGRASDQPFTPEVAIVSKPRLLIMNGKVIPYEDARVHVLSTAMKYAASVYEAMRGYWSDADQQLYVFRLRDHLRRLQRSAKIARIALPADLDRLEQDVLEIIRANGLREDLHVRLIVFVDTGAVRDGSAPHPEWRKAVYV